MFFKRAAKTVAPKPALGSVQTIPEIFYGGSDPEAGLHGAAASKSVKPSSVVSSSGSGAGGTGHTKLIAALMIVVFIVVSAGAAWGYWKYLGGGSGPVATVTESETNTKLPVVADSESTAVETATSTTPVVTSTSVVAVTSTPALTPTSTAFTLAELAIEFPDSNQLSAPDSDSDTLTDLEEDMFTTDPSVFDSDADGYSDGQELVNLFNPKGTNPVRLAESGLVREFTHPRDVYRLYYPISWQAGSVDAGSNTMLFTAANGDYIEARIFTKNTTGEDFSTWFGKVAKNQKINDLQIVSNSFKTSYYKRKDNLVLYVDMPGQVLVIVYHPLVNAPINYRATLQMIMESLRISGAVNTSATL